MGAGSIRLEAALSRDNLRCHRRKSRATRCVLFARACLGFHARQRRQPLPA
ncbi:hypothetical protein AKJ08_2457 [Vulgatibacter incomptus]|uniref:Uncharacterized protein n=1 Tax=Vulgatibacter incomptus TaxID=1391653 RepID=A0A0K1PEX4_9BACT|nr:hypothetical protein AKJ08_2457 [Vulgatibacter incomptus]